MKRNGKNNLFLSVVIPVHNMERYLDACVESVLGQGMRDCEIVLVNDGSTDHSQEIIDRYAGDHPGTVRCIRQENQGLGPARNAGIASALGEYVMLVDADDWLEENTLGNLCAFTKKYGFDLVAFDSYRARSPFSHRNLSSGHTTFGPVIDKAAAIAKSTNPAHAWKRLYRRELFAGLSYPAIWFEDIALTPLLTARAEKPGYFKVPVYNYRIRDGSITDRADDPRNAGVIHAWSHVLDHMDPAWTEPTVRSILDSIRIFCEYRPAFRREYLEFYDSRRELFERCGGREAMSGEENGERIPRIIHYCWFGGAPKGDLEKRCLDSWRRLMPDFEIREWNEDNCDVYELPFTQQAYVKRKWAFVADYFRFKILNQHGGVYLDTDVEANASPERLLRHPLFLGFESRRLINAAVMGSEPGHPLLARGIEHYAKENFISRRGLIKESPLPKVVGHLLMQGRNPVEFNGARQTLDDGVELYPVNVMCLNVYDGENIFEHHFNASWWDLKPRQSYKHTILKTYFRETDA